MDTFEVERFLLGTKENKDRVQRALARRSIRRLRRGLYTADVVTPLPILVREHIWDLLPLVATGCVIGYRTALEMMPSPEGVIHMVGPSERRITIHGTRIWIHRGPGPLSGDRPNRGKVHIASRARAYLEVLKPSRAGRDFGKKGLSAEEVRSHLEQRLRVYGADDLNRLLEHARSLGRALDAESELSWLERAIESLVGTGAPS